MYIINIMQNSLGYQPYKDIVNGKMKQEKMRIMKLFFRGSILPLFNRYFVIIKSRLVAGKDLCLYPVIRECGSTPYAGLACAVPSSNSKKTFTSK